MGAARHVGLPIARNHRAKSDLAEVLATEYGLPPIAALMPELNSARKASAYGDTIAPDLDAEDVAIRIESYVRQCRLSSRRTPSRVKARADTASTMVIRRWPSSQARKWVREFVDWAVITSDIKVVVAIGSAVRDVPNSVDVDLLVAYQDTVPDVATQPIDVDLRYFRVDDLRALALQGHDLIGWALKFGAPIVDKDGHWHQLERELCDRLPFPSRAASIQRAQRARDLLEELLEAGDEDAASEQLLSLLTHLARAVLVDKKVYPTSRPELPSQLRSVGETSLAHALEEAIMGRSSPRDILRVLPLPRLSLRPLRTP